MAHNPHVAVPNQPCVFLSTELFAQRSTTSKKTHRRGTTLLLNEVPLPEAERISCVLTGIRNRRPSVLGRRRFGSPSCSAEITMNGDDARDWETGGKCSGKAAKQGCRRTDNSLVSRKCREGLFGQIACYLARAYLHKRTCTSPTFGSCGCTYLLRLMETPGRRKSSGIHFGASPFDTDPNCTWPNRFNQVWYLSPELFDSAPFSLIAWRRPQENISNFRCWGGGGE